MLFNSLHFLIFFPVVTLLYFWLPFRRRWILLLAASAYFYMSWRPEYILLVAIPILIDYVVALQLAATADAPRRKRLLTLSIVSNLGILFIFKYVAFFNESTRSICGFAGLAYDVPSFSLILPVGISFYTFQSMSYAIDVYRRDIPAERNLGTFALYVLFFPQLVAGPIERASHLLPQFARAQTFVRQRVVGGLFLILWGMFKKVVIADRLASFVEGVYLHPHDHSGLALILATVCFAFEIYYDFCAYSEIAVGAAQVLGVQLMDNFRQPYLAKSTPEFWKRWHISLSTWFRDYLYIPLGGNRVPAWKSCYNLFVTFLISGLWHGASWTFVIWGALNGFYVLMSRWTAPLRDRCSVATGLVRLPTLHRCLKVLITFALTCLAWVFFRAASLTDALYIVGHLFSGIPQVLLNLSDPEILESQVLLKHPPAEWMFLFVAIVAVEATHYTARFSSVAALILRQSRVMRWGICLVLTLFVMDAGKMKQIPFIYFQF